MSHASKFAERLLAHAHLWRQIARESSNEETAQKLEQLAEKCMRAAADVEPSGDLDGPIH